MANNELVLVVDFGAQYAQLIARRVRQAHVYSEIVPSHMPVAEMLSKNPKAIILSGGPSSVYAEGAPTLDPSIFDHNIPIFGICYGFQAMASALGGTVTHTGKSEFGRTAMQHRPDSKLLKDLPFEFNVWMSHGDSVTEVPAGFVGTAKTAETPIVAYENHDGKLAGVQFHPESVLTEHGHAMLANWLVKCGDQDAKTKAVGLSPILNKN